MMTGNWGAILISAIVIGSIYLWWKGGLKRPNVPTGWMTWPAWADSQAAAIVLGVVFILAPVLAIIASLWPAKRFSKMATVDALRST